jgi:hypothetical protein
MIRGNLLLAACLCQTALVFADVGDVFAESNFRQVAWNIEMEKGKDAGFLEHDTRQVRKSMKLATIQDLYD